MKIIDMTFGPTTTELIRSNNWATLQDTDRADGQAYGRFRDTRHELAMLWAFLSTYAYNGGRKAETARKAKLMGHASRAAQRCLDRMTNEDHSDWETLSRIA